jgi:sarcosine oxidase subunit alpha
VRGDRRRAEDGMIVSSINHAGSLDRDYLSVIGLFSRFLPVGFYYRTFFRPNGAWKLFERPIRALAGLGKLDPTAPHGVYDKAYAFCDVLVVGGGPAGLMAAVAAASAGADVTLVDEWPEPGGSLLYSRGGEAKRRMLTDAARAHANLTILSDATVTGLFADNWVSAVQGSRLFKIRAKQIVLATGGFDQPVVFAGNDRPGVMFADAAQRLMKLYAVRPGHRAVIATSNHLGYEAALDCLDAGIEVAAIVDLAKNRDHPAVASLRARGVRIIPEAMPAATRGKNHVEALSVRSPQGTSEWIDCDLVLMGVGYTPALNLASHAGARIVYDEALAMHRVASLAKGLHVTGAVAGIWSEDAVLTDGQRVGARAASLSLGKAESESSPAMSDPLARQITHPFPIADKGSGKAFVDFDEDLSVEDIENSVKTGYDDIQLVKRYSTVGIGPSQGRHSNLNTIRIVAKATGRTPEIVGTTTFRPPLIPEKFAHMAGRAFEPVRLTAMHQRHIEAGAKMMVAGLWMRPAHYGGASDGEAAIAAEVEAVRRKVGMIDVSTLGGLDIRGPDAAAFVERIYTFSYAKQPVGRARYALMTDNAGVIIDDGVACRFHDRHFYVTATTSGVDQAYRQMLWWNAQWKMDVDIANVTAAYAGINVAGPKSRAVMQALPGDIDYSAEAFPYMAVRKGQLAGIPIRVLRVGFVGELGFEIHCPSSRGAELWDALAIAGKAHGIRPFGVEAQRVMRLEKGHIIIGQDTDGLTHPGEAAMEAMLSMKKPFFVGQRSIRMQMDKGLKRRLVGFILTDTTAPAPKECHLVIEDGEIAGRVTSAVLSPTLGKVIGLAYVPAERSSIGQRFTIRIEKGRLIEAEIVPPPFYDPQNQRQAL